LRAVGADDFDFDRGNSGSVRHVNPSIAGERDWIHRISNDGMTGSQVTGILNALGYQAQNLSFGMTGWTRNSNIAPGQMDENKDILGLPFCWLADPGYYVGDQPSTSIKQ